MATVTRTGCNITIDVAGGSGGAGGGYYELAAPSHGLVAGDLGKPLAGAEVLDDTSATQFPSHILVEIISANTLKVAPEGTMVELPVTMLDGGAGYDTDVDGRYVWWDESAGLYKSSKPGDSAPQIPDILEVFVVGATTFEARVRSLVSPTFGGSGGGAGAGYYELAAPSHGLVAGDVGKPLSGAELFDDTSATQFPSHILVEVLDADTLSVAPEGTMVELPVALLDGGAAYDISVSGRYVWWDASAGLYVAAQPGDSATHVPDILEVFIVGGTTFEARVRSLVATGVRANQLFGNVVLTDAATVNWDTSLGPSAELVIGGNRTLGKPTNIFAGQTLVLRVTQDGAGGRTLGFHADFIFPGGAAPSLSAAPGALDLLSFVVHNVGGTLKLLTNIQHDFS